MPDGGASSAKGTMERSNAPATNHLVETVLLMWPSVKAGSAAKLHPLFLKRSDTQPGQLEDARARRVAAAAALSVLHPSPRSRLTRTRSHPMNMNAITVPALRAKLYLAACLAVPLPLIAGGQDRSEIPWPTKEWTTCTPAEQGMREEPLQELTALIDSGEKYPDIHSLLVVRRGHLVLEEYFNKQRGRQLHTLQSVTKSFASAAIGIAIERGEIKGVDEPVLGFFEGLEGIENVDEWKKQMVLEDLLTMRSGTDYFERGPDQPSPHKELNELPEGWTEFYLSRPMTHEPGTHFQYDSGGVILLSGILKARTGRHADAYLEEHLFQPLGIEHTWWYRNAEGHPHTGGGLMLTSRDMAKFGLLYLNEGKWDDRQVISSEWVRESTRHHSEPPSAFGPFRGYGYLWWLLRPPGAEEGEDAPFADLHAYSACGYMGQYIMVVPERDLVVVVTAGATNGAEQAKPFEFLYSFILPATENE
jgi:CubicO group peptidase (beta-lactamase class C family)